VQITRISAGVALAVLTVLGGAATASASTAPAHYTGPDKAGCHAAYDLSKHGLSGVGLPTAVVLADLQSTEVWGSSPYKQDSRTLLHLIVNHKPWRKADQRLVAACGSHH
jgi:hypothetical protein